jgi:uncharacterized protein (TIGR02231 family)
MDIWQMRTDDRRACQLLFGRHRVGPWFQRDGLMRGLFFLALLIPAPVFADTILAKSTITAVTVYPEGAQITREVQFDAPAGQHEVLITDLPGEMEEQWVRLTGSDGLTLGAFSLRTDRLPPREEVTSPELDAAKDAVEALEAEEQAALAVIAGVTARVEAAEAQAGFLQRVQTDGGTLTVEALKSIAQMIGVEVLAAKQAALMAQADLPAAQKALTEVQEELAKAHAAYDALPKGDAEYVALSVAVNKQVAGAGKLVLTHYVNDAYWGPIYDIKLERKAPSLTIERGVFVGQDSGEDWGNVDLTLSTSRPNEEAEPSGYIRKGGASFRRKCWTNCRKARAMRVKRVDFRSL